MGDRTTAVRFFNEAVATINDKSKPTNPSTSFQLFASACNADPTWGQAFFQHGNNCSDLNFHHAAVAAYRRALEHEKDPAERIKCLSNIGWRLFTLGQLDEAYQHLQEALKIDPKCGEAWVNLSQVYGLWDESEKALEAAQRGFDAHPEQEIAEAAYAFALLFARRLKKGFHHFEVRFKWRLHQFLHYPYPKWKGEDNKTVFLVADQGLGDTLCYGRFVHAAAKKARYIHCYIQPELMRLYMHAFAGIPNLNLLPFGQSFPPADVWTTFVSLPYALGLEDDEIRNTPNIRYPTYHLPTSWMVSDQKLHVGVAWAGSKLNDIDEHRSIPVQMFLELARVPGVQLYALQVGEHANDADAIGAGPIIKPLSGYLRDVCDTISILQHLDLVIGCESALGHICSMINKEFWMPYSFMGRDYRVGHKGDDVMWAPKHKIFKQGPDRNWAPVFSKIVGELQRRVDNETNKGGAKKARAKSLAY